MPQASPSNSKSRAARRRLRLLWFAALGLLVLVAACSSAGRSDEGVVDGVEPIRLLDATDFAEYVQENPEVDVINVHVPYEGHIDGTDAFVDFERILEYGGLPENRSVPVALYCRSGSMSGTAAQDLAEAGFTNIVDLNGGMNAWTSSGRELLLDEPT
ncbi:MAG: rhodanese-like domain-containing protein [Rhodothermales bacterium]|nr:rhodanese-like domain-containing protein [Rhodothermales bacterium]